jgi:hypothetical protein
MKLVILVSVIASLALHANAANTVCPKNINAVQGQIINLNHYRGFNGILEKGVNIKSFSKKIKASSLQACFQKCVDSRYSGDPNPYTDEPGECATFSYQVATKNCYLSQRGTPAEFNDYYQDYPDNAQQWCPQKGFTAGFIVDQDEKK